MTGLAKVGREILFFLLTLMAALLVGALLLLLVGKDPVKSYMILFWGAFGSSNRIAETLVKATPLIIMGIGISIAFRNQVWNIGGDGQFIMGAILAVIVALNVPGPAPLILLLTLLAAFAGGACWGGIIGFLKARFNANEVITTLMFNYIASYLLQWLVRGPMIDPNGAGFPQTPLLVPALRLPHLLAGTRLHSGLLLALVIVFLSYFFWRSRVGFRIQLVGESQEVARYCGLNVPATVVLTMLLSGGLAGLAGWTEVFGIHYRLLDDLNTGYGSLAIVVALLGNLDPIGIMVASFFFAALLVGGSTMQRLAGTPFSLIGIIEGLVIIFAISRIILARGGWQRARGVFNRWFVNQSG